MSAITDLLTDPGAYELVQGKVLETLQADSVMAAVIKSFGCELYDENKQFGRHEIPRISCITERKDQEIDSEGMARADSYQVIISIFHQGLAQQELITDAQRLAAYLELLLEAEGRKSGGFSGLDTEIDGAEGSLMTGAISTEFYANRHPQGNVYQVESLTACEIILVRPLVG